MRDHRHNNNDRRTLFRSSKKGRNQADHDTHGFIGHVEHPADEVGVGAVLHCHVERRRLVERGHRRAAAAAARAELVVQTAVRHVRRVFGTP